MRITGLAADNFLSFQKLNLKLAAGALVVTGPNGSGKSNLARCLDLTLAAVAWGAGVGVGNHLEDYAAAGYKGSDSFVVRVGVELDRPAELQLVRAYLHAAAVSAFSIYGRHAPPDGVDRYFVDHFEESSADSLGAGDLVVRRMGTSTSPWQVGWEFKVGKRRLHLRLGGSLQDQLFGNTLLRPTGQPPGGRSIPALLGQSSPFDPAALPEHLTLADLLPYELESYDFRVHQAADVIPPGHQRLGALLGLDLAQRGASFVQLLCLLLGRSVVITENHRLPLRPAYELHELAEPVPLRDGSEAAGELWRLYNGNKAEQERYGRAVEAFEGLTGRGLALRTRLQPDSPAQVRVEPVVVDGSAELPVVFAGAGVQEALVLATLLAADPGHVLVLDEPAVNLAPAMQRRLWHRLSDAQGQVVVITHSPDLVPAQLSPNLTLMRLSRDQQGTCIHLPNPDVFDEQRRLPQLLRRGDVRALLFASGVVLCEGDTEVGALSTWWSVAYWQDMQLPAPDAVDVVLVDAGGDAAFRGYTDLLDVFGVPWVIVCDGPALKPERGLSKQYVNHPRFTALQTAPPAGSFGEQAEWWRCRGVYSFADCSGTDGTRAGEFERYLEQLDHDRFQEASKRYPRSKVRQAEWFAAEKPCPPRAADLWRDALTRLGASTGLERRET